MVCFLVIWDSNYYLKMSLDLNVHSFLISFFKVDNGVFEPIMMSGHDIVQD